MNSVRSNSLSLKYPRFTQIGFHEILIVKLSLWKRQSVHFVFSSIRPDGDPRPRVTLIALFPVSHGPACDQLVCVKNYNGFQRMEAFVWAVNKINRFFMIYIHVFNDLNITYLKPSIRVFKLNMPNSKVASISSNTFCILRL